MNEIVKALIDFDARVSTFKVWIVLISHKHGEDVELYSEYPDKKFLNKIKMCALQSFDVQYTPDGSYMTYEDGSMTSYQVSMSFGELNPIYQEDYDTDTRSMGY